MPIRILKKKPSPKRNPGTRAGMTRAKIINAATALWLSSNPDDFSVRALAKVLKVGPTTIHAHFKGGVNELRLEMARAAVAALAPPHKPQQDAKTYLREFFRSTLTKFRQKPELGRLVVGELANDPLLSPIFADRVLTALELLTRKTHLIWGPQLFLSRFAGLVMIETGGMATGKRDAVKNSILSRVSDLPAVEYPMLKQAAEPLAADIMKRTDAGYLNKAADRAAEALVAEFAKGQPKSPGRARRLRPVASLLGRVEEFWTEGRLGIPAGNQA